MLYTNFIAYQITIWQKLNKNTCAIVIEFCSFSTLKFIDSYRLIGQIWLRTMWIYPRSFESGWKMANGQGFKKDENSYSKNMSNMEVNKFHKISTWIPCLFNLLWWSVLNLFWWCVCFRAAANTYNVSNLNIYSALCSNLSNPLTATLAILKRVNMR